jgi:DNA-binding beta-propeller fold protein YncE
VAVDPTNPQVYVAAVTLTVHNGATLRPIETLPLAVLSAANGLAIDSRTDRVYLTRRAAVTEYNLATHKQRQFATADIAGGIAVDPAKRKVYVTLPDQNAVTAISVK